MSISPNLVLSDLEKGELVWFDPGVGHVLPGEVLEYHKPAQVLNVQAVIAGKAQIFSLTSSNGVHRRQDLGPNGLEDMIQLSDLNEASLLWNLKIRYDKELIYTYVGSILVAVNPYKMYDMYGLDMVKKYEGQILGTLSPHLFAIGSAAYSALATSGNQVVVISGESGSGKTECTKLVMQYLAAVNKSPSNLITEQILEASPLLESFGNAKTVRNDNSSRFGKFLQVHFKDGVILGAKVTEYLLEKSRIVTQAPEERNYHVFYELLSGLSDDTKLKYGLLSPDKYFYLNQGGNCEIDGKYDGEDFQSLMSAMQVLGFTSEEQDTIFRILASVLHLGNVYFHRKQLKHGQEGVEIGSDAEIRWTGHLLKLEVDGIKQALTTKTTEARNERLLTALTIDQALDTRDAFAKALYSSLFAWLVARINHIVYKGTKKTAAISILDIFGFEDFKENSFEQLCINYANENLQFYFNKHIFKLEQQEYIKEKISWQNISFTDNVPVIHLLSKKPVGILHLLDDESNFPKATDVSFLEKCHYNHALNEFYSRPRLNGPEFGVKHYAGPVWYNVDGFLDKNRDTLRPDVVELLISSSLPMLSKMFVALRSRDEASKTLNKANGRFVTMKPRTPTVAARFHDSLSQLLDSMAKCRPWFVRCVKPNAEKAPMRFDMPTVLEQLRYSGMLETIRIRKLGYPIRLKFSQFIERYRYLLPHHTAPSRGTPLREICHLVLAKYTGEYQLGTSRVFLRENLERLLERRRANLLQNAATDIQKHVRGFLARKKYVAKKQSAVKIQAAVRGWRERKRYVTVKRGITKAQAHFRGKRQRARYHRMREDLKKRSAQKERAKIVAQREEAAQEKAARAGPAGVNQLDIPAELAFILNKLEDWTPPHVDRNLVKVVGPVVDTLQKAEYDLPEDIDQHAFSKFSNIYFKSHVWGMKREPIKSPFLNKNKDSDFADSLAIFKLILRFMNDDSLTGKKEQALGDYIAYKGLSNEKLRDEILCQLVNQTWRNDNTASCERGWLLMANCLSVFSPSAPLYKFLLKYVSDHAYNGYKQLCQRKLLQSHNQWARACPPSLLEWRANRKRVNMGLQLNFADGESLMAGVDSWSRCESLCSAVLAERGVSEIHGWTLSLERPHVGLDLPREEARNGLDYVLDSVAEMEASPHFPSGQSKGTAVGSPGVNHGAANKMSSPEVEPISSRRPTVPPPQPPPSAKMMKEKARSVSRDHTGSGAAEPMGLSRQSALNDRYFDPNNSNKQSGGRSRSLDNLLTPMSIGMPSKLETMGLSKSRLNDRYHSMERIQESVITEDMTELKNKLQQQEDEDIMESVSQRGENRKYSLTGESSDNLNINNQLDFDYPDVGGNRSEDDRSYIRGHPRFIKSQYAGKRAAPGSHSSKAQIETRHSDNKSEAAKSSAMSDTSEAPSLASHVRRVRVPSQASDVDQFLDDLFSPVLDQLSDARSLAASIKGGGKGVATQQNGQSQSPPGGGSFSFNPIVGASSPVMSGMLPTQPLMIPSLPVYNSQGMSLPAGPTTPTSANSSGGGDPSSMIAYQANLQQAFLQSAMAQNIQIQQQLFAQNQALQQLLQQRISVTEPPAPWHGAPASPPGATPAPLKKTSLNGNKSQGGATSSPSTPQATFTSVLSELKSRRSSTDSPPPPIHRPQGGGTIPPPPPPMPPPPDLADPSEARPFMDPYGRAKTVRIGKWRWPPPQGEGADNSFLQFKLKQQRRKHSAEIGDPPENGIVEWEEFEMQSESQGPVTMATSTPNINMNNTSTEVHRGSYKSLEVGASRPSPGSVGKLRISNEMKHKLEMVTANHSLRSTDGKNQRPSALPVANKLDSDRRMLLQQQLAGRWGSMDSVDSRGAAVVKEERSEVQQTNIVRSQAEKVWRGAPPPPVVPHQMINGPPGAPPNPPSRSSSFYDSHSTPPPPIQPVSRDRTPRLQAFQSSEQLHHHHHHAHMEDQHDSPREQPQGQSNHSDSPHPPSSNLPAPIPHHPMNNSGSGDVSKTELYSPPLNSAYFAYNRITWKLNVRKEVFSPKETVSSPLVLHLVFCQIVTDTLTQPSPRISPEERSEMMQLLEQYGVTKSNMHTGQHKASTKRAVLDMARHWLMYFTRIFTISGGHQYPDVQLVAISHSGIRLARTDMNHLRVLHNISLEDISESVMSKTGSSLQVVLQSGEKFPIHSARARQIHAMLHAFIREGGAILQMQQESRLTKQWLNENHHSPRPPHSPSMHLSHSPQHMDTSRKLSRTQSPTPMIEDDGKHSLLQFAMHHFRQFEHMKTSTGELTTGTGRKKSGSDWTWREQLDLVKFTCVPIPEPLLKVDPTLAEIAVECFECIMRFMGDLPTTPDLTEVKCVYTILMHCHTHEPLRDEVYCQLMKQTTSNKTESCQRGWRLLSIVAAYFTCSDTLRPFLLKYLETAAYDKRRAFHGTASVCLQNLRKTLRYGGRKNVPSVEEVTAVSAGRNSKRQLYRLPGGSETVINTKSTTVVDDICMEMCQLINVNNDLEMEEFSLYCIVEGDAFTMPLAKEEYILDVTTELHKNQQVFYLIFCRSVWYFPLRLDCQLYVQVLFNQIAPDYLEGLLLVLPNEQIPQDIVYDVAKLAALLHRAADMSHPPAMKETKFLLPKPALTQRDIKPAQWVQMVQGHWGGIAPLHSIQAKAQLLEILSRWPLFGSSFFAIKRNGEQQILALNKQGVHFLHLLTHETLSCVPYSDVISTRKVRAESGTLYLEMKCGNLFQQRVARLQTDQAHEIARLIRQYMSLDTDECIL
uniref:Unconventional myosin-XV n=1 Tax=Cacopsylla melanoneura TaxID=428564 RepID=A0A8D9AYW5_9HEMI